MDESTAHAIESPPPRRQALRELAVLFLRLGTLSMGGPAGHIAMMEDEVVRRRRWVTHERFLDMLGVCNLIPGPKWMYVRFGAMPDAAGLLYGVKPVIIAAVSALVLIRYRVNSAWPVIGGGLVGLALVRLRAGY